MFFIVHHHHHRHRRFNINQFLLNRRPDLTDIFQNARCFLLILQRKKKNIFTHRNHFYESFRSFFSSFRLTYTRGRVFEIVLTETLPPRTRVCDVGGEQRKYLLYRLQCLKERQYICVCVCTLRPFQIIAVHVDDTGFWMEIYFITRTSRRFYYSYISYIVIRKTQSPRLTFVKSYL